MAGLSAAAGRASLGALGGLASGAGADVGAARGGGLRTGSPV